MWSLNTDDICINLSNVLCTTGSSTDGTVLVITGTGFDPIEANNNVTIGGEPCTITSASETQLECDIGPGPAGTHDVIVYVSDKGYPSGNTFTFTYLFELDSVEPSSGSVGGKTEIS